MQPIATYGVAWSVCWSVSLSAAELIVMACQILTRVVPRNHILDGVQISPSDRAIWRGSSGPL